MKKTLDVVLVLLVAILFLAGSTALARKRSNDYKDCIKGCNIAKTSLLKACGKMTDPVAKKKCRTVGVKKLKEACHSRCKK